MALAFYPVIVTFYSLISIFKTFVPFPAFLICLLLLEHPLYNTVKYSTSAVTIETYEPLSNDTQDLRINEIISQSETSACLLNL